MVTDHQVQLSSALGALLLAQTASAHGFVKNWIIDEVSFPGFSPSNPTQLGATANRPTDNGNNGEWILVLANSPQDPDSI